MQLLRHAFLLFAIGWFVGGCAVTREDIDLRVAAGDNPTAGTAYRIVEVVDKRAFEISPDKPSTPSLKNNEVNDKAITSRAVARKRNTYGAALGDYMLPEGRTVAQLTTDALTRALRDKGYRVLNANDPGYEAAVPLQADIEQFWAWFSPGFSQITIEFQAKVNLRGNWPLAGSNTVTGSAKKGALAATTSNWLVTFNAGIEDLIQNTRGALRDPSVRVSELAR